MVDTRIKAKDAGAIRYGYQPEVIGAVDPSCTIPHPVFTEGFKNELIEALKALEGVKRKLQALLK